ncbi:DNA polymerase III subunit gamma/tau [Longirhabdus pacifica]|uniref:DNA polymerase III subunit gamma/tau n=1 Tax=Longirhabdus pacifica TaxID=2305227 RepID=UPI0010092DC5|nr:DNA polymerase III subunit gamma/tau [Longirhabdus pacifica]
MDHIALYRAWRPQQFAEIIGQQHIVHTLQNALRTGQFSHAYLFCGPRGTGKTSAAKVMAKALNCENSMDTQEPCNQCKTCIHINAGSVMDVLEIDAASNRGVEEIRELREKVKYAPTEVRCKVYIIDEVHMLTTEAFNALLKTLEEPPPHVVFILATTDPNRVPATILSRCQRFDFRRIRLEEQVSHLKHICEAEHVQADDSALEYIARLSDGGLRDAVSLLDQIRSFAGHDIQYHHVIEMTGGIEVEQFEQLAHAMQEKNIAKVLIDVNEWIMNGKSADQCLEHILQYFRDLLWLKHVDNAGLDIGNITNARTLSPLTTLFDNDHLFYIIDVLSYYQNEMKYAAHPQMILEVGLMKSIEKTNHVKINAGDDNAQQRITQLEQQLMDLQLQIKQIYTSSNEQVQRGVKANEPIKQQHTPPATSIGVKRNIKLEPFVAHRKTVGSITSQWANILQLVKNKKITVHAWLVDGEPVSIYEDRLLVAFKNAIHRETTDKPSNTELIQQAIQETIGKPIQLETVMMKDWQHALTAEEPSNEPNEQEEPFQLQPDKEGKEWITEAKQLFGESNVKIKDDKERV